MTFEKYVNGPQFEDFTSVQTTDHIYVFEQKYEDQPLYHNGHRVISSGTRLRIFDCNKKEWSQIKEIEAFKDQEDGAKLDEIVFNIYDEIYVLLFNRFEGVKLDSLWRFDHEHFKFEKYSSINHSILEPSEDSTYGHDLILVAESPLTQGPYFIARIRTDPLEYIIFQLKPTLGHPSIDIITRGKDLGDVFGYPVSIIVNALYHQNEIYMTLAAMGCGYKWEPNRIVKFDLSEKTLQKVEVSTDALVVNLPNSHYYDPMTDSWYHFSIKGNDTTVYILKGLQNKQFKWEQSVIDIDEHFDKFLANNQTRKVFGVARNGNLYSIYIDSIHA